MANAIPLLVVEDEPDLRGILVHGLTHFGFEVRAVADGAAMDRTLAEFTPQLLVLDLMLPGEDGWSICRRLQPRRKDLAIVMLTARNQTEDRIRGLNEGADRYFSKPVDLRELAACLHNLHQRLNTARQSATWTLEMTTAMLIAPDGQHIGLTSVESTLLRQLLQPAQTVVPWPQLCRTLWNLADEYARHRLEVTISRLRTKVREATGEINLPLQATEGGYQFAAPARISE